jgi:hypothetical protein
MTVCVVLTSLIPILWESGVGSDVMNPIAAPIVGGMITSIIPVLIYSCAHSRAGVFRADEGTLTAARNVSLAGQRSREGLKTRQLNISVIRRVELGIRLIFRI